MSEMVSVMWGWVSVYGGLALFFLLVAPRFPGRGYEYLGWGMFSISLAMAVNTWMALTESSQMWFLGNRFFVMSTALAPAFNTHFILVYVRLRSREKLFPWLYSVPGALILADGILSLSAKAPAPATPGEYWISTSPLFEFIFGVLFLHWLVGVSLFMRDFFRGNRVALWTGGAFFLLGLAVCIDLNLTHRFQRNYFLTEAFAWIYGLFVVASLLSELRGKEGLLEETTSHLAERTAQLQHSYAAIELMHTELTKKEQLAAVGELAASIAHEVRNPLAIIMNACSGLRRSRISEEDKNTLLAIVDEEAARLNQLVTELLRFARPMNAARAPASLVDICEQVKNSAPEGYQVEVQCPPGSSIASVWVDSELFRLALDNLLLNAVQSMPEGGTIVLAIREGVLSDGVPALAVEMRDQGHGMNPEDLERAQKPFFTTRPRGTGLGLPIVGRIVEAHGGEIQMQSQWQQGTCVTLLIPLEETWAESAVVGSSLKKTPSQRRRMRSLSSIHRETLMAGASSSAPAREAAGVEPPASNLEAPEPPSWSYK